MRSMGMLGRAVARGPRAAGRQLARRRPMCTAAAATGSSNRLMATGLVGAGAAVIGIGWYRSLPPDEPRHGSSSSSSSWVSEDKDVPRAELISRYEFKKRLGKGGFGDVWLAIEVATGRQVAVKKMSLEDQPRTMVEQEVSALRRCGTHPNVVQLLEVVWVKPDAENRSGEAYLVMELATGGGMFERLVSEGAYTELLASAMMQQIARRPRGVQPWQRRRRREPSKRQRACGLRRLDGVRFLQHWGGGAHSASMRRGKPMRDRCACPHNPAHYPLPSQPPALTGPRPRYHG